MQCDQCGYTCTRKDNLLRHERSKHGSVMFQCENCDFKSNRKDNLARHMLKHSTGAQACIFHKTNSCYISY